MATNIITVQVNNVFVDNLISSISKYVLFIFNVIYNVLFPGFYDV